LTDYMDEEDKNNALQDKPIDVAVTNQAGK
jgi:hypothetical protein